MNEKDQMRLTTSRSDAARNSMKVAEVDPYNMAKEEKGLVKDASHLEGPASFKYLTVLKKLNQEASKRNSDMGKMQHFLSIPAIPCCIQCDCSSVLAITGL